MKARGRALLLALSLAASSPPAAAAETAPHPLTHQLSVARSADAADCPDTAQLAAMVEPLLRGARPLDVRVDVQVSRSGQGYAARLRVSGQRLGQRSLDDDGSTCTALAEALAVTVAMLLDGRDEPVAPAASSRLAQTEPTIAPPAPRRPRAELSVRLAVETTVGLTALGATGPAAEIAVHLPSGVELGLGGSYLPPASYSLGPGRVEVSLATARLRGCYLGQPGAGGVRVGPCGLVSGGQMTGEGQGFFRDRSPARSWAAAGVGLAVSGTLVGRLRWLAEVGSLIPWERKSFSIDRVGAGPAFEEAPVAGFLRFGLEAKIL